MVKKPDGTPLTPLLPIQTWHLACPSPTRSRLASVSRFPAHGDRVFVYIQSNTGILDRQTLFNKLSNSLSLSLSLSPPLSLHIPRICRNSNSTESERILIPNFSDVNLNRDAILIEKEREREREGIEFRCRCCGSGGKVHRPRDKGNYSINFW
jgi:hypothetical protein